MTDMLTPGSLPARVLAHMLASRVEQSADEIAEELKADASEVRQGLFKLRELGKVLRREEDGHPVYRLPDAAHMRIPGSALQAIPSPLELRQDTKPAKVRAAPTPKVKPPKEPPMTAKPPVKPGTDRARMLELIAKRPGLTGREIARALNLDQGKTTLQLQQMKERGLIEHLNGKKPFEWKAKAERADASTPAEPKPARAKPRRAKSASKVGTTEPSKVKPAKASRKLHELGIPIAKPAAVDAIDDPVLAIDADGVMAIESVKLSPTGIRRAVEFLEKTQHVWQGVQA